MADILLGEFNLDITPPVITNEAPEPGAVDVNLFTNISFNITDVGGSSVDVASIDVKINGTFAVQGGIQQSGYSVTFIVITNGFSVIINPDSPLSLDSAVVIEIDASDQSNIPNFIDPSHTWSFTTNEGVIVSPALAAVSSDSVIQLSWSLPPPTEMLQELFQLRKALDMPPTTPDEGALVYEGLEKQFLDSEVVNGVRYYYTIFIIRRFLLGEPEYVPYETQASATAVPREVVVSSVILSEYVPKRGELGARVTDPAPHGTTKSIWGVENDDGIRRQSDLVHVEAGRPIQSPIFGTIIAVKLLEGGSLAQRLQYVEIETPKTSVVIRLSGFLPLPDTIPGVEVQPGQVIGRTVGGVIEISLTKLPVGSFGRRTIRPTYLYTTVENRD